MRKWYEGGRIYPLVDETMVEVVVTEQDRIVAVGRAQELQQWLTPETERVNLAGATMYPGFVDSHIHFIGRGEQLQRIRLDECTSLEAMLQLVERALTTLNEGEWLIAEGWNEERWSDKGAPTKAQLNALSSVHPIVLKRQCRHSVVVNDVVLQQLSLTAETVVDGGHIEWENGRLHDAAQTLVLQAIPPYSREQVDRLLQTAKADLVQFGLTGVHTEDLSYYQNAAMTFAALQASATDFRVHVLAHHSVVEEVASQFTTARNAFFSVGSVKFFLDGSLGSHTAYLSERYADQETNGLRIWSDEQIDEFIQLARRHQLNVAVHTIGDGALTQLLDALERNERKERDRIIHVSVAKDNDLQRAAALRTVFDLQPIFAHSDRAWLKDRLGTERLGLANRFRDMKELNIPCAGGSDAPIESPNPFWGIYSAVTNEQPLTRFEALQLYTSGSAYVAQQEALLGTIEVGKYADFTIVDRDLLTVPLDEVWGAQAIETIVAGQTVFKRN